MSTSSRERWLARGLLSIAWAGWLAAIGLAAYLALTLPRFGPLNYAGLALLGLAALLLAMRLRTQWIGLAVSAGYVLWAVLVPVNEVEAGATLAPLVAGGQLALLLVATLVGFCFPNGRLVPAWTGALALASAGAVVAGYLGYLPATIVGYAIFGLIILTRLLRLAPSGAVQRQQIGLALFGVMAAFVGTLALDYAQARALDAQSTGPLAVAYASVLPVAYLLLRIAAVLTITLALLRIRLWEVERMVRRTLVAVIVTAALVLLFVGVRLAGLYLLDEIDPAAALETSNLLAMITAGLLFAPLRRSVQWLVGQLFYRQQAARRAAVLSFIEQAITQLDLLKLLTRMLDELRDNLDMERGAIFLRAPDGSLELAKRLNLSLLEFPELPEKESFRARLNAGETVDVRDDDLFVSYVPMIAPGEDEGEELVAVLGVGPRSTGAGYSNDDKELIQRMTRRLAAPVNVARLLRERRSFTLLLRSVIDIGVRLSGEKDRNRLLEHILLEAKSICNADGGTLYLRTEDNHLAIVIIHNDSLNIAQGGTSKEPVSFEPLPLYDSNGEPLNQNVATYTALHGETVHVRDVYEAEGFDFSGTSSFDEQMNYHSKSFLSIPLVDDDERVIGVLQLTNALHPRTEAVIPFESSLRQIIEALSRLASVALTAYLREESLRQQIDALRIAVDNSKLGQQVEEITGSDYFGKLQDLQSKAGKLREQRGSTEHPED